MIFACGFVSVSDEHANYYDTKIDLPSLHISGATDKVIPQEMHLKLADCFVNPVVYRHDGGHLIPATSNEKTVYRKFFEDLVK